MSDYTLGKIEFERHADAVMTSLADSVVRHMAELDEANARIAVLEEEQKVLKRERDNALAAVTEGGTGNSGVERPEPSPHFSEQSNLRSQAVTTCDQIVRFLRTFNRWRRGDITLEQPSPREVGLAIDAACNEIERLERQRDEARRASALWKSASKIWRRYCANTYAKLCKLERERDEARQQERIHYDNFLPMQDERDQWRECAENLIDYARECLASFGGCGHPYCEREMDTIRKDIARYERLKEASK
jgi:hypothetical protein